MSAALKLLAIALVGALFGIGLVIAQMVDPAKVLAFLDPLGGWDPSLALVMGGGLVVTLLAFPLILRRGAPLLETRFHLPEKRTVDGSLLGGAILFGLGWGLAGYCPGPALTALGFGWTEPWLFVAAMAAGSWLAGYPAKGRAVAPPLPAATVDG
ncbi:MAG: DUF6691 family protein [Pseudomonadota bacterium]|nr:DUF6691 family protein [Pseudomonadota bacterium]